jgi:hypothetical protein
MKNRSALSHSLIVNDNKVIISEEFANLNPDKIALSNSREASWSMHECPSLI